MHDRKSVFRAGRWPESEEIQETGITAGSMVRPEFFVKPEGEEMTLHLERTSRRRPGRQGRRKRAYSRPAAAVLSEQERRREEERRDDNAGIEAADASRSAAQQIRRSAGRSSGIRTDRQRPGTTANFRSRRRRQAGKTAEELQKKGKGAAQQKRMIRRSYAAAFRNPAGTGSNEKVRAAGAVRRLRQKAEKAARRIWANKSMWAWIAGGILLLAVMMNMLSSCGILAGGFGSAAAGSLFYASDMDMRAAEAHYASKEEELEERLERYEQDHDYQEYSYDLDETGHDPYVLISAISAIHPGQWRIEDVADTIAMLFDRQYILEETVTSEIRYRTETVVTLEPAVDPDTGRILYGPDGNPILIPTKKTVSVPYEYRRCSLKLENFNLSHVPVYVMSEDQLGQYALLMSCLGNRPDLFPESVYVDRYTMGYTRYEIPDEDLEDPAFAAMIAEAERYLGYPYIWGGSSPKTSFDCSGYVSWVINQTGWDVGRLGAGGLWRICSAVQHDQVRPGDLVFFEGTYETEGVSHVGIYAGRDMMIHCGDPISYTNLRSQYWQSHLYGYGRLPERRVE